MTILAIADRPPSKPIRETLAAQPVDLIVTLGDLGFFELQDLAMVDTIPKVGVYGNHCSGTYFTDLGIMDLHLKTWEFGGLTFGGFQGSVRYKENPEAIMYTQEEATAMLQDFPRVDVMLVHCPPYGINDDPSELSHTGYIALRTYLDQRKPAHLFHGHTYPDSEHLITQYGQTAIHYVYSDQIITL
jgi:hypothetical protein